MAPTMTLPMKHWPAAIAAIVFTLYIADALSRPRALRHRHAEVACREP